MGYTASDPDSQTSPAPQEQRYLPGHSAFHALHLEYHFCFSPDSFVKTQEGLLTALSLQPF